MYGLHIMDCLERGTFLRMAFAATWTELMGRFEKCHLKPSEVQAAAEGDLVLSSNDIRRSLKTTSSEKHATDAMRLLKCQ